VLRNKTICTRLESGGYVHLRLGAYRESIDDYNMRHLKPDLQEAVAHRRAAYLAPIAWTA